MLTGSERQGNFNGDLTNIITPIDVDKFEELLRLTNYDPGETEYLTSGFRLGFDLGYRGSELRQNRAENIPFTVGNEQEMWGKLLKEVRIGRVAGPFEHIPYSNYIQSPIGLVPKAGNKTRLIFHLSHDFDEQFKSFNSSIAEDMRSVHYNDLDYAIKTCLKLKHKSFFEGIFLAKSDLTSAFKIVPAH